MDAQLDAENAEAERRLELARETLFKPEARLEAELSFLPDCRPSIIRQVTTDLAAGQPVDAVTADLDGVALCNVLLHYLPSAQYKDQTGLARRIIDELAEIDVRDLMSGIEQAGQLSGFDSISHRSAKRAVEKRFSEIIDQTVTGLSGRADFPEAITMIAFRDGGRTSQTMPLLNAYERKVSAKMDALEAKSIEGLDKLLEATNPQTPWHWCRRPAVSRRAARDGRIRAGSVRHRSTATASAERDRVWHFPPAPDATEQSGPLARTFARDNRRTWPDCLHLGDPSWCHCRRDHGSRKDRHDR